ncbi:MAG: ATP-binding protein [Rubricoccaceae bacterium]
MPSRLALRIALLMAGALGLSGGLAGLWASGGRWGLALLIAFGLAILAGGLAYTTVRTLVVDRLEVARKALRDARKRKFKALMTLPPRTDRDEIDALIHQVNRAGQALQKEIERLERAESYRREFLGDVSHELRTPIFAVSGFAETLLDGALDDDRVRRRFVEKIRSNAQRLETLSRDLSAIANLETGRLQLDVSAFPLNELACEIIESLEQMASGREVSVAARFPEDLPQAKADRDRLRQVLTNLVENAIKYNEPGGAVEIVARSLPSEGRVRISVVDDGIGIPAAAIPRLTDRFFRVDKSRSREQGGTGLGLAIVKHILEAHGQKLSIDSRESYGSTFSFSLPVVPEGADELKVSRPEAPLRTSQRRPRRPVTPLQVDELHSGKP